MKQTEPFLLPAEMYPFLIEALHPETRKVVWSMCVAAPADPAGFQAVTIPPLSKTYGHPVLMRITWPDGTVSEA